MLRTALSGRAGSSAGYAWNLPKGFPKPYVPADNPMTAAKVELGRYLFYDTRMSVNGKASCATCHKQELAFTDGRAVGVGATGEPHSRSAMSLVNVAYSAALTWSNPQMKSLEEQALTPMFGDHPVELGLREGDGFPADAALRRQIPRFVRTRLPRRRRSLYDRQRHQGARQLRAEHHLRPLALRSLSLRPRRQCDFRFRQARRDAVLQPAPFLLPLPRRIQFQRRHGLRAKRRSAEVEFHNTGLYNVPGLLSYPAPNVGIYEYTKAPADVGKFKAPTLRNIAVTAPYMHDGSIPTLEGVLDHYAAGGRAIPSGPHAGNGHDNPNKDPLIGGFALSAQDRDDLIAFLKSLTDEAVLHDPRFANPWRAF